VSLTPGTRLGSYEVAAQIGAGGMGEVYRARDAKLDRHVALKVLPAALAALIAGLLANFLFTPPYGSLTISQPENAFALVVFVVVGVSVASVMNVSGQTIERRASFSTTSPRLSTSARRVANAFGVSGTTSSPRQRTLFTRSRRKGPNS